MAKRKAATKASSGAQAKRSRGQDERQIRALYRAFLAAFSREDARAISELYAAEGFVLFDVGRPRAHMGREDSKRPWQSWFDGVQRGSCEAETQDLRITVVGDYAFAVHFPTYKAEMKDPSMAHLGRITARATTWWAKTDGKWFILVDHQSVPVDLKTRMADFSSRK